MLCAVLICGLALTGCKKRRSVQISHVPVVGKIELPLYLALSNAPNNKLFNVVVVLKKQVTDEDKRVLFQSLGASNGVQRMEQQRTNLLSRLQNVARVTQAPMLGHLRALETHSVVRNVHSMWIANMLGLQAPPSVINSLATSNEVQSIHWDSPQPVFYASGDWGLKKIGMPLPVAPVLKQTVVVAVLDTGVDYTHPDLAKHIWVNVKEDINGNGQLDDADIDHEDQGVNGYTDDVIGWNFSGSGTHDPQDVDGHGTHIAGIIVGDGTSGTRTGIAPGAQIMALRESSSFQPPTSTEQECWRGMEYAVSNKAHIINFSSGWLAANNPAYAMWRNAVQNATDAGVLFVTVSGDSGTSTWPPHTVTTPGRVPGALTVGASTPSDSVPSWSCEGPITWQENVPWVDYPWPPGLQKPDLVAPGEGINSTRRGGGYVEMGGTSMAAPHVSGVAALLRGQNPDLNPYEVRFILEETAAVIYEPVPDPTYGWGRLDATAALGYGPIKAAPLYDMEVSKVRTDIKPQAGKSTLFFATVANVAGQVVGNAELQFYFSDAPMRNEMDLAAAQDGKPDPTKFIHIGSYYIPVLGPSGSKHERFEGVVRWTLPTARTNRWWLGVRVLRGASNEKEVNEKNNQVVTELVP
jgi:subtilisin family serine protease